MNKKTNEVIKIKCAVCDEVKDYEIESLILTVVQKICSGSNTGLYRCCDECQEMVAVNPLAYEKKQFPLKEHLVELTAMKYGLRYYHD
jgi:hypothetical protein